MIFPFTTLSEMRPKSRRSKWVKRKKGRNKSFEDNAQISSPQSVKDIEFESRKRFFTTNPTAEKKVDYN